MNYKQNLSDIFVELSLAKNVRGSRWALSEQINPLKGLYSKGVS